MLKTMIAVCMFLALACQQPETKKVVKDSAATAAAATVQVKQTPPDSTVLEGAWYLQPVLPSDTATGRRPTLQLDVKKSRFTGNTGCNNMNGKFWFSASDSSISFSEKLITTKMACPGYNEKAFLKSLLQVTHFKVQNGVMTLIGSDNAELSRWERKPSAPANTGKA